MPDLQQLIHQTQDASMRMCKGEVLMLILIFLLTYPVEYLVEIVYWLRGEGRFDGNGLCRTNSASTRKPS